MTEYTKDVNTSLMLICYGLPKNSLLYDPKILIILIIINIFISVTATLENLLVLVTIWRSPNLHSPSNTLLFGLALSDLCVGFAFGPINVGFDVHMLFTTSIDLPSCTMTNLRSLIILFLTVVTLLTITAMSVDRYLAIYLHLRYEQVVTERRTRQVILFLWLISGLNVMIFPFDPVMGTLVMAIIIIICLLVVLFAWIKIYQVVRHHQAQIQDQMNAQTQPFNMARFKKSAINTMFILILIFVCYLPLAISKIAALASSSHSSSSFVFLQFSYQIVYLNSSLNPLVYCWRQRDIRAGLKQTVMKCCSKT